LFENYIGQDLTAPNFWHDPKERKYYADKIKNGKPVKDQPIKFVTARNNIIQPKVSFTLFSKDILLTTFK